MSHDTITLEVQKRETVGKRLGALRRSGYVPAVIHDHGKDSVVVQSEYNHIQKAVNKAGKNHLVAIAIEDKKYNALVKDITLDPRKNTITHVVFNAVKANEKVDAEVPVRVQLAEGNESTPAERSGFIVLHNIETIDVEALPKDLPDALYFDGEKLVAVGDHATVGDLIVPSGVVVKTDAETTLATVFEPSAIAAANDAAGGDAEPGDAAQVEAVHESTATEGTSEGEDKPGGRAENQDKGE